MKNYIFKCVSELILESTFNSKRCRKALLGGLCNLKTVKVNLNIHFCYLSKKEIVMRFLSYAWSVCLVCLLASFSTAELVDYEAAPVGSSSDTMFKSKSGSLDTKAFAGLDYVEYLYGVSNYNLYLLMIDHLNNDVCSADLSPLPYGPFYGAASSGSPDFFWATTGSSYEEGTGSALYKIFPAEKISLPIGSGYGQNPRYPGNPDYVINMRELAYNDDTGILYGTDYLGLYTIDTATGTASLIGDFGTGIDGELIDYVFSMEYDSSSMNLYITNQKVAENGTRLATHLYSVDMTTAVPTYVGDTGTSGLTDMYNSHISGQMFAAANADNRLYQVDPSTGSSILRGNIADNILGLSGEFLEVPGPQVWFPAASGRPSVTVYSKIGGVTVIDSASTTNGKDKSCSAQAFVQESGQPEGVGQQTDVYSHIVYNHDSSTAYYDIDVDFSSVYNGSGQYGSGGATVEVTWEGTLKVLSDETYPYGTRVLVLVDGNKIISDQVSNYVLDFEMKIYDSYIEEPVMLLTEDDIPIDNSTPFLGAFYTVVGGSSSYSDTYRTEMKLTLDIDLPAGDTNTDGIVNILDFQPVAAGWLDLTCNSGNMWCLGGDVSRDGGVGIEDLAVFAGNWLQGKTWNASNSFNLDMDFVFRSVAIPETPTTLNDECADAVRIVPGVEYFGTTTTATGTDITSCNNNDTYDVWYKFTPDEDGIYEVYARNFGPEDFYPCIALFDSCGGTELECWSYSDDIRLFEANTMSDYYIRIADYGGSTGDFKFAVIHHPAPENDNCDSPTPISKGDWVQGTTLAATPDSVSSCGNGDSVDVWYSFTPDETGSYAITLEPSGYTSFNLSVFNDDCNEETRQEFACINGNESMEWPTAQLGIYAVEGETYLIRAAGNYGYVGEFNIYIESGPENDICSDAIEVSMWDSQYSSTVGATGTDITSSCGVNDSADVWYKYTAEYDHMVMFQVYDESYMGFPVVVSVFDACNGAELVCAESAPGGEETGGSAMAIYQISTGETVYVRVAFSENAMGYYQLNIDEIFPPDNDECDNAQNLDGWTEGSTVGSSGYDQSSCGDGDDSFDVWYQYVPGTTGEYIVYLDSYNMPIQGTIAIFDGNCSALNELYCSDIYGYGEMSVNLVQGQTYYFRVGCIQGGQVQFGFDVFPNQGN